MITNECLYNAYCLGSVFDCSLHLVRRAIRWVRCPSCSHANDFDIRFCQRYEHRRKEATRLEHSSLDSKSFQSIDERLQQLNLFPRLQVIPNRNILSRKSWRVFLAHCRDVLLWLASHLAIFVDSLSLRMAIGGLRSIKMGAIFLVKKGFTSVVALQDYRTRLSIPT